MQILRPAVVAVRTGIMKSWAAQLETLFVRFSRTDRPNKLHNTINCFLFFMKAVKLKNSSAIFLKSLEQKLSDSLSY